MSTPEERWRKLDAQIEKQHAAIRDLIVVSRTLIDAQQNTDRRLKDLAETMKTFLKNFPRPNGSH